MKCSRHCSSTNKVSAYIFVKIKSALNDKSGPISLHSCAIMTECSLENDHLSIVQLNLSKAATQKEDQKLVFKTDYSLMQVKSIAEWGIFCNTFELH